jgi:site-specific DNA recombinase
MKWKSKERASAPSAESPRWRGYGYVRVSTEEQMSGVSLAAQEEKIRAWASLKDVDLVEVIRDEGYSGKNLKRPGFERLLELIRGSISSTD